MPVADPTKALARKGRFTSVPEGYFGRNHRKWLETAQPTRQKAIQGLLSRFRWSPRPSIFDGFFADLNRALSALFFQNSDVENQKNELGELTFQDFELSKNGAETSFLDSSALELQNELNISFFRQTDCHFPAISGSETCRK